MNLVSADLKSSVITRYNLDTDLINRVIDTGAQNGQTVMALTLPLWEGIPDGDFWIDWKDGMFIDQNAKNFTALTKYAKGAGYRFFVLVPEYWGPHDFRTNPDFGANWDTLYNNISSFCFFQLKPVMDDLDVDWLLDLVAEGLGDNRGLVRRVMKTIWSEWTGYWSPGGVPCPNASISFVPSTAAIQSMPDIFRGLTPTQNDPSGLTLDPNEPINWPWYQMPHPYDQEIVNGTPTPMLQLLTFIWSGLQGIGAPDRPWVCAETDTLVVPAHRRIAADVYQFVTTTKQLIECMIQWGVTPDTPSDAPSSVSVLPNTWFFWPEFGM